MHITQVYKSLEDKNYRVLVVKITSPNQVLTASNDSIHEIIKKENLSTAVGIYFYRFKDITDVGAFSKIGEVSRREGVIERKFRGWLAPNSYGDSYMKLNTKNERKGIFSDVLLASEEKPMYFVFYEFDVEKSFPKIDEITAFGKHIKQFGYSTRNNEKANTFVELGSEIAWYSSAFDEVFNLKLPSGELYP